MRRLFEIVVKASLSRGGKGQLRGLRWKGRYGPREKKTSSATEDSVGAVTCLSVAGDYGVSSKDKSADIDWDGSCVETVRQSSARGKGQPLLRIWQKETWTHAA
jgi:hypothetical protein